MIASRPSASATRCSPRVISAKYGSDTSCTITPTALRCDRASIWACAFGTYLSSATAASTRARSASATGFGLPLMIRDAVAVDTPACRATSAKVAMTGEDTGAGLARGVARPLRSRKALTSRVSWEDMDDGPNDDRNRAQRRHRADGA